MSISNPPGPLLRMVLFPWPHLNQQPRPGQVCRSRWSQTGPVRVHLMTQYGCPRLSQHIVIPATGRSTEGCTALPPASHWPTLTATWLHLTAGLDVESIPDAERMPRGSGAEEEEEDQSVEGQLLMDPVSFKLGTKNQWGWLVSLLSNDPEWLDAKVKFFLPNMDPGSRAEGPDPAQRVLLQLRELRSQGLATWKAFIQCVCMELEVPLELEVRLMSTWGHGDGFPGPSETGAESQPEPQLHLGLKRPHQSCGSSPRRKQLRRQQLELAKRYLQQLKTWAQQRHGGQLPGPGQPLASHQAYVPPILQWGRATAPFRTQEGADADDVSLQALFGPRAAAADPRGPRVTVLLGKAGMGKTTLARRLCQRWAAGRLGRFLALFLFEFRQLGQQAEAAPTPPTQLAQLLFDLSLRPEEGAADAVLQYLEGHAARLLLVFDGLDEALHPEALALFSGLCRGTLLPGCRVLATSRPGKLPACLPAEAAAVHLWGFDGPRVEEYVGRFFDGDRPAAREAALAELRANGHLRGLCAVPAQCRIACLCLRHLLPGLSPGQSAALLPTVTQTYVQMVLALAPRQGRRAAEALRGLGQVALGGLDAGKVIFSAADIPPAETALGAALGLLTSFGVGPGGRETGYAFAHLSLQEFLAALHLMASPAVDGDAPARRVALRSRWVLRTQAGRGLWDHLPAFLAGLASPACRPFLERLAEPDGARVGAKQAAVLRALGRLAAGRLTGPKVVELCRCVGETQEPGLARRAARSFPRRLPFRNFPLAYADLAALTGVLGHREAPVHLDFEGCPLEPRCPEALAGCGQVESLSFKSRKCGDAFAEALARSLPTMGSLKKLGLAGSKITARGIHQLVQALPLCPHLEEVSFQDNQLKSQELLDIVEVLPRLPRLRTLDLSHNKVSVATLLRLTEVAVRSPAIRTLQVRETDLVILLSSPPPPETAAEEQPGSPDPRGDAGRKEAQHRSLALRLQKCRLTVRDVEVLLAQLQGGPLLEEVDLSGNQLEDEGCRLVAEAAPRLHIAGKLDLSDNGLSVAGLPCVLRAAGACPNLADLHVSLTHRTVVLTFASELEEQEETPERAAFLDSLALQTSSELPPCPPRIRLPHCGLRAEHLEPLCAALEGSARPGHLDLSRNALGDEGAAQLPRWLPALGALQSLDLSENGLSLDAVLGLARCFSTLPWVLQLDISFESQHVILRGGRRARHLPAGSPPPASPAQARSSGLGQRCVPRSFRLSECGPEPRSLDGLCEALEECPGPLEVRLTRVVLSDQSLDTLLGRLPWLPQLRLLQLSQTPLPPRSPFLLAGLLSLCPRVEKVALRSFHEATLHLRSREEQKGGRCGFTGCGLSQAHVEPLCELLGKCEGLGQLDLSANQLGDGGLRCLLMCLPRLPISGSLDLSGNSVSLEGALCLVETLPSCPRVREAAVDLGSQQSLRIHLSPREETGKALRLRECGFRPEHMTRLAAGLSQAWPQAELTLSRCGLGLPDLTLLLRLLRPPEGLLRLRVEEPWMGRAGLPTLLQVCAQASGSVTEISVSESQQQLCLRLRFPRQESPEAVAHRLARCDLEAHHSLLARQLAEACTWLRRLSLCQVRLCRASCLLLQSFLPPLSELKAFRLASSRVSAEGLAPLAAALSHCGHLEELGLSNNQLGEDAAQVLMEVLGGRSRLERLDLSHFPLDAPALAVLTRGLSRMTRLQSLCLSHNRLGDAGALHVAAVLPRLPELRRIDLSANGIGPAGGVRLVEALALCGHLEELLLGCNALGDPTALELARQLPPHLRVLHLRSSRLGPDGALSLGRALEGCPRLEELSLAENALAGRVPHFRQGLPLLRQIDLVSCEIDDPAAKLLAASLTLCPALEEILLSWNLLGDEAAAELAQVLPRMQRLQRVDLEKNQITAYGAWLLAEGLAQSPGIQVIRLWNNRVPPDVAKHLQSQEPRLDFAFFPRELPAPAGT